MTLPTFRAAAEWLRDHLDELETPPARLHDSTVGDKDATGAPRFSGAFWAILTGSPYATREASETIVCPLRHPITDAAPCARCGGQLTYVLTRQVYVHPLTAALERLSKAPATSPDWPTPHAMCVALIHAGLDLDLAAQLIGHPILGPDHRQTVEAAFTLAVRKLWGRWSSGPIPAAPKWTEMSSSQQHAIEAGEAA